jgi:hypothetical protein
MANGAFNFKNNSGNIVSFISGSDSDIIMSGGTLDLSNMTGVTLGNITLEGTVETASFAPSYLLTSSFNTYTGTTNTVIGTLQTSTGSLNSFTSSTTSRLSSIETSTSSLNTFTSSATTRLSSIEGVTGSYATTGSNIFRSSQTITGSLFISENLVIAGSSSIQYISSSVVNIDDNIITVNAMNPSVRFGGLAVIDSGSSPQVSGSMLFDSVNNQWVFVHQNQASVTSSVLLMGPETFNNLGNEAYLTLNRLPKGTGIEHLVNSNITDTGTKVSINSNTEVTGTFVATGTALVSGSAQILNDTTIHSGSFFNGISVVSGSIQVDVMSTTNITRLATTGSNTFTGIQSVGTSASPTSGGNLLRVFGSGSATNMQVFTTTNHATFFEANTNSGSIITRLQSQTAPFVGTLTNNSFDIVSNGTTVIRTTGDGNVTLGTTNTGADGLSLNNGRNLSFAEGSGESYVNIFRQRNSAALVMGAGYKRSLTGAFASSFSSGMARAAIAIGYNNGSIAFFSNPSSTVANGTDIGPTERMTLINNGNFGLGTTTPYGRLHLTGDYDGAQNTLNLENNWPNTHATSLINFWAYYNSTNPLAVIDAGQDVSATNAGAISFKTMLAGAIPATRMIIKPNGNIGINTITPNEKLEVKGNIRLDSRSKADSGEIDSISFTKDRPDASTGTYEMGAIRSFTYGGYAGGLTFYSGRHTGNGNYGLIPIMTIGSTSDIGATNMGIGTTAPASKLTIYEGDIRLYKNHIINNTGTWASYINFTDEVDRLGARIVGERTNWDGAPMGLGFDTGGVGSVTRKMTITSTGNVGIFDNTPAYKLSVNNGTAALTTAHFWNYVGDQTATTFILKSARPDIMYHMQVFNNNTTECFRIEANGNVKNTNSSYGSLSDIKIKENILDATPKLEDLLKVKIRNYNIIGQDVKQIGVIAQELEEIFPSMVDENEDRDENGDLIGTYTKGVKYSVFVPILIKSIQEQQSLIESLKLRIENLENL